MSTWSAVSALNHGVQHCLTPPVLTAPRIDHGFQGHDDRLLRIWSRALPQGLRWTWLLQAERPAIPGHPGGGLLHLRGREYSALPAGSQVRPGVAQVSP